MADKIDKSKGWISIYRCIRDHWVWQDKPFSYGQAWIDMLLMANHSENKIPFGNGILTVEAGSFITSELKLMERWGWSKTKLRRFLSLLISDGMIVKKTDRKKTTINIVNYSDYQIPKTTEELLKNHEKTNERPIGDQQETDRRPIKNTNNNENNVNNENNSNNENNENKFNTVSKDTVRQTKNVRRVIEAWNSLADYGIKPVTKINSGSKRYDSLVARINEYGIEDVLRAIEKIKESKFLQGKTGKRQWVIKFDWFVLPSNFPKVLEGNYDDEKNIQQQTGNVYLDAIKNRVSEVDNW